MKKIMKKGIGCNGCIAKNRMFEKITSQAGSICAMVSFMKKEEIKLVRDWCNTKLTVPTQNNHRGTLLTKRRCR